MLVHHWSVKLGIVPDKKFELTSNKVRDRKFPIEFGRVPTNCNERREMDMTEA